MKEAGDIYQKIISSCREGKKMLAVLVDPDKSDEDSLMTRVDLAVDSGVDFIFVGGSLLNGSSLDNTISVIRANSTIPVVIFPGSPMQINNKADAILLLSLISGRNPDLLIGDHVIAAPYLKKSGLEIISTGYMLVESGRATTASYISQTIPLPKDKPEIAACTAMAGEMLGIGQIYMDAGSGAKEPISAKLIEAVKKSIDIPLIVGGGIREIEKAKTALIAGADIIVIGNAIEENPEFISSLGELVAETNTSNTHS